MIDVADLVADQEMRRAWAQDFLSAQKRFPPIGKDTSVEIKTEKGTYRYKYAPLPDIIALVTPILHDYNLHVLQSVTGDGNTIGVETRIYHGQGHVETFGPLLLRVTGDAKAAGSAITYARRYALCAALGIAPDEDDEGTAASTPPKPEPAELTPWQWFLNESKIFKGWTTDQVEAAAREAFEQYAYTGATLTHTEARNVLEFVRNAYETQGQLDV